MKLSDIFLNKNIKSKITRLFQSKVSFENVIFYNYVARKFFLHLLATYSLRYIQRCFSDVAKTENFTQIDFTAVKKLLSSPELNITSELEIMKAADTWISYNYDERSKFAKDLLLTVRLYLLPDETLIISNRNN